MPAGERSERVTEAPRHTFGPPVTGGGAGSAVTDNVAWQAPSAYVMVTGPGLNPAISPVDGLMLTDDGLELVQVPSGVVFVSVAVLPRQITSGPPIGGSEDDTVTGTVR